jgi:hypothetical protein
VRRTAGQLTNQHGFGSLPGESVRSLVRPTAQLARDDPRPATESQRGRWLTRSAAHHRAIMPLTD